MSRSSNASFLRQRSYNSRMIDDGTNQAVAVIPSCRGCGYSLHGLESRRCPECGRPFDLENATTLYLGRREWVGRRWLQSNGRAWWITLWLLAGYSLWVGAVPGLRALTLLASLLGWLVFGLACRLREQLRDLARWQFFARVSEQRNARWRRSVRLIFLIANLVVLSRLPMYPLFWVSRPALTGLAVSILNDPTGKPLPAFAWCGASPALPVDASGQGVVMHLGPLFLGCSIAYIPNGPIQAGLLNSTSRLAAGGTLNRVRARRGRCLMSSIGIGDLDDSGHALRAAKCFLASSTR